jgi:TolB-like protein/Tfp pilus assembly protein PilF
LTDLRETLESTLGDTYTFERELAAGGMSRLFLAQEKTLARRVVVKVLPEHLAGEVNADRFRREIQLSARLQHAHIVPVLSSGEIEGIPYFVMPFIEGESLRERIDRKGELTIPESVRFFQQIASALAYAHKRGVVHRDIKPDNVLIADEIAVVTDFGVAKALEKSALSDGSDRTSAGVATGTPAYMSPEQASADPAIDHRADIYSLGIVMYEMLTGQPPFTGRSDQALLAAHTIHHPEAIERRRPNIPEPLARLVMQCLEKRPADRPQSAQELLQMLDILDIVTLGRSSDSRPAAVIPRSRRPSRLLIAAAGAALVFAIAAIGYFAAKRSAAAPDAATATGEVNSVAVLPLVNVGGEQSDEYFSEGMTDELANALNKLPGMRVASRTSAYAFKGNRNLPVTEIGRQLNVQAVLEGTVRRAGGRLRVSAQLTSVSDGLGIWSETYEREASDVFKVQDDIARSITEAIKPRLRGATAEKIGPASRGTENLEAFDLYLRGRYFLNRRGADNLRKSISFLDQAISTDPSFARAHAALAIAYALLPEYTDSAPADAADRTKSAAIRALELDNTLAEANTALGLAAVHDWDFDTAGRHYRAAIAQDPAYATAHQWYGELLYQTGQVDSSVAKMRTAADLDPLAPIIPVALGYALTLAGRYPEAISVLKRGIELNPGAGLNHATLAMAYFWSDNSAEAVRETEASVRLDPEVAFRQGQLAYVYGKTGQREKATAILHALQERARREKVSPTALAPAYVSLGDNDNALSALERAVDAHDIALLTGATLVADRIYDPLRGDPRFERILSRMHLAQYATRGKRTN